MSAAPEKGKANRAVLGLLAAALDLAPSALELVSGAGAPNKTVYVPLAPAVVIERLGKAHGTSR